MQLGVKVSYAVPVNNEFRVIRVGNDAMSLLDQIRQVSNQETCANFETRINNIKTAMRRRNAPQQQFEEISKIGGIYIDLVSGKNLRDIKSEEQKL